MTESQRKLTLGALFGLVGIAVVVAIARDTPPQNLSFAALVEPVTDTMRAADRLGALATRVSIDEELAIGNAVAKQVLGTTGSASEHDSQEYVQTIVNELVRQGRLLRPRIPYRAHVLNTQEINAYALPGGHVFITQGMLDFMENEAELAFIIGHEIAHVDRKHCIERIQYELAAEKLFGSVMEAMVSLASQLYRQGFSSNLEAEADRQGILMAVRAGYHPQAGQRLFARLQEHSGKHDSSALSIPDELGKALGGALHAYFDSHPRDAARIAHGHTVFKEHGIDIESTAYYVGERNFYERIAMQRSAYDNEWRVGGL